MSTYTILAGGYRNSIAKIAFDAAKNETHVISESPTPTGPSWVTAAVDGKGVYSTSRFFSISEDEKGLAISLKENGDKFEVTAQRETQGGPCHVHAMKDGSGIVVSNYVGGSVIFIPTEEDGTLASTSDSVPLRFQFTYDHTASPNPERQDRPHAHHCIEGEGGLLYVADLGGDRIWFVRRDGKSGLKVDENEAYYGYIQTPPNFGPRHMALSPDGKLLYVLGELGHSIMAYPLPADKHTDSVPHSTVSYLPPDVPSMYTLFMDGAEIAVHPTHPRTLYASNRLELHVNKLNPTLPPLHQEVTGDAVAVITLKEDGSTPENVSWVRTGCCCVRGMQVSPDGKYVAVAGQCNSTVEIYAIEGDKGEKWRLVVKEGLDSITDFLWV